MDDLDESLPAAEGAVDAEQSARAGKNNNCLNCGAELRGPYCHVCGQKDLPQRQSTRELFVNFISSFTEYEGKFINSVRYLITRPGFLALDYTAGRRERYFHPVRMYAFISFVFFLIFFSLPEDPENDREKDKVEMTDEDLEALKKNPEGIKKALLQYGLDTSALEIDSTMLSFTRKDSAATKHREKRRNRFNYGLQGIDYKTMHAYDSVQATLPVEERDGWLVRRLTQRSIELNKKYGDKPGEFGNDFWKASLENFSSVLFFLLPVFAFLLKLLYVRRNYFYSEHLVFSIYYYNFFYLAGSVMMLVGLVPWLGWLSTLIGYIIYFYLLVAMKRMYGQGWGKTVAKFLVFSFTFMLCFFFAFLINLFVIVMIL